MTKKGRGVRRSDSLVGETYPFTHRHHIEQQFSEREATGRYSILPSQSDPFSFVRLFRNCRYIERRSICRPKLCASLVRRQFRTRHVGWKGFELLEAVFAGPRGPFGSVGFDRLVATLLDPFFSAVRERGCAEVSDLDVT